MPNIYLTTNLYNKENNILPFQYIGSDQNDNDDYLGSNIKLKQDIQTLGKENFKKEILISFINIENNKLRKVESQIQKSINCAEDKTYYNRTNTFYKELAETEEEKKERYRKIHATRNNRSEEQKKLSILKYKATIEAKTPEWRKKKSEKILTTKKNKSEEEKLLTSLKMSESAKKKIITEETRKNYSEGQKKRTIYNWKPGHNLGKFERTPEMRKNYSEAQKNAKRPIRSEEAKKITSIKLQKLSLGEIYVYDYKTGEFVGKYFNATQTCKELKLNLSKVSSVVNGNRKHTGGYTFKRIKK